MKVYSLDKLPKNIGGNKAQNLACLKQAGLNISPGFVLDPKGSLNVKSQFRKVIEKYIDSIGGYPLVVRSSANKEDSLNLSFAGQFDSVTSVNNWDDFQSAVTHVVGSVNSPDLLSYCQKNSISVESIHMFILVQRYFTHEVSSVTFTLHPFTGDENTALVEYHQGSAESLVSGHVTPKQLSLPLFETIPEDLLKNHPELQPRLWRSLAEDFRTIQAKMKCPQDIEWAWSPKDGVVFFQTRPLTSCAFKSNVGEMTNADFRDGGVSATVSLPMMFSLYEKAHNTGLDRYFTRVGLKSFLKTQKKWITYHYGRIYWNVGLVKHYLLKMPGFNEKQFDLSLGINKIYGAQGPKETPSSLVATLFFIPSLFLLVTEFIVFYMTHSKFMKKFKALETDVLKNFFQVNGLSDSQLNMWVKKVFGYQLDIETYYCRAIANCANFFNLLNDHYKSQLNNQSPLLIDLIGDISSIPHLESQKDLDFIVTNSADLSKKQLKQEIYAFCKKYYYKGFSELNLLTPRWFEDPSSIEALLKTTAKQIRQNAYSKDSHSGGLPKTIQFLLRKVRVFISKREQTRIFSSKAYAWIRIACVELSNRLVEKNLLLKREDIFFMRRNEILIYLNSGTLPEYSLLEKRRDMYLAYSNFPSPGEFGKGIQDLVLEDDSQGLSGIPCSPGEKTGVARVIFHPQDMHRMKDGEILVTKFTDPAWTPALGIAGAVVTEVGGVLSHAAIIAREYRVPAVLNLGESIRKITDGDFLKVNGSTGKVEILETAHSKQMETSLDLN